MVKRQPPPAGSRDLILAAALEEFAARGFDGAKVDRIAGQAGLNKAMLYYHFRSKRALFLEILRTQFGAVADAVEAARKSGDPPDTKLRRFVETMARQALARPHFPPMWLREIADGGRHVDASVIAEFRRILGALAAILAEGQKTGTFVAAHPFVVQMGLVAPLMFFAASRPLRERAGQLLPPAVTAPDLDTVIRYVQDSTLAVLSAGHARGPHRRATRKGRTR
jgi:AcrR family transcriptional regulator